MSSSSNGSSFTYKSKVEGERLYQVHAPIKTGKKKGGGIGQNLSGPNYPRQGNYICETSEMEREEKLTIPVII